MRPHLNRLTRFLLIPLLSAPSLSQGPQFNAESRIVLVPVIVTDVKDHLVAGIPASQFELLDNGIPQKITVDTADSGVAPISLVVAIQSAGISTPVLAKLRKIGSIFQPVITGDRGQIAVATFADQVEWVQEFTADDDRVQLAFRNLQPSGNIAGRMLDAIAEATQKLANLPGRKVVLLIAESKDRGSNTKLADTLRLIGKQGVQIFAATYSPYLTPFTAKPQDVAPASGGPDLLAAVRELARNAKSDTVKALTQATGGDHVSFATQKTLEGIVQRFGQELQGQYLLSFTPANTGQTENQITVRLKTQQARLRYRQQY